MLPLALRPKAMAVRSVAALSLLSLSFVAAGPAQAGLFIQDLEIRTVAETTFGGQDVHSSTGPGLPTLVTAASEWSEARGFAMQGKDGLFQSYASSKGSAFSSSSGSTVFDLVVGTDAPNTPLTVKFSFIGAFVFGNAYYGAGDMQITIEQRVLASFNGAPFTDIK